MEPIFTIIVVILMVLAVAGLVVGVTNDAVNFLNSAIGSKAAPFKIILAVASAGIIIGALTSSGMMEVARSGVFHPTEFTFAEVMTLFLGVMFANVILLDLFNTFGLPTSTTVSLVFGLLGAAIAVAIYKISKDPAITYANIGDFINSSKTMVMILAILLSVVLAFFFGSLIMFITRVIFTFRYSKVFRRVGALWCGAAFTAIVYFALFKGFESSTVINPKFLDYMQSHILLSLTAIWAGSSALMYLLQYLFKINILKITILAGTFSLALAFAGNDLVNFIGVPMAGWDSYMLAKASPEGSQLMMGDLMKPVTANIGLLLAAGLIMVTALWTSKKARSVSETEINLAKQNEGVERFGSTMLSRSLVRLSISTSHAISSVTPEPLLRFVEKRFLPLRPAEGEELPPFDMIRATVNLTVASILISIATSLTLPLSTTYVTFMVAMGSSLADRAWGRESAVYRVTGVLTVVAGWFVTGFAAFLFAFLITLALVYGKIFALVAVSALAVYLFIQSNVMHKRRKEKEESIHHIVYDSKEANEIVNNCIMEVRETMGAVTTIYHDTMLAVFNEDRRALRKALKESNELFYAARERKYEVLPTLQMLQENYIETGHYYVQVVDYMSEATKALVHITRPCFDHINNNHEGLSEEQVEDLMGINEQVSVMYDHANTMLRTNDFSNINEVLRLRDTLFVAIDEATKSQLRRIKRRSTSTKTSMLYLTILSETKTMVLQSRNLLKSQKKFVSRKGETIQTSLK